MLARLTTLLQNFLSKKLGSAFSKFLEAFIQMLLFAEVSQRSHALSVALLLDLER